MTAVEFMARWGADDGAIDGVACLEALLRQMDEGLAGRGRIPMVPSYLGTDIAVPAGAVCAVLDAGGTNLRTARAVWDGKEWHLEDLRKQAMPGTQGELSCDGLYDALAAPVQAEIRNSTSGVLSSATFAYEKSFVASAHFAPLTRRMLMELEPVMRPSAPTVPSR